MKKFTRTGKKALSVFLAALMVMTAWVFVAPEKALAATVTGGTYYYKVQFNVKNDMDNVQMKSTLYGKKDNGTGQEVVIATKNYTSDTQFGEGIKVLMEGTTEEGIFPTRLRIYDNNGAKYYLDRDLGGDWSIFVGSSIANAEKVYLEGNKISANVENMQVGSGTDAWWYWQVRNAWIGGKTNTFQVDYSVRSDYYPKATKVHWVTSPPDITIPSSSTGKSYCEDQYGVKLACDPTYTFSSSPTTGLSGSRTLAADGASYTVTANNDARMSGQGNNERNVTMTASYTFGGQTAATDTTKTFKIKDPVHTTTANANGGTLQTAATVSRQWGDKYGVTPGAIRNGYTLLGFYPTAQGPFLNENTPSGAKLTADHIVTGDSTWYAAWRANKYTATFSYRDTGYVLKNITKNQYYTTALSAPDVPSPVHDGVDYTYEFTGWNPAVPATMPANNQTYTAQYNRTIHYADYTQVVMQIGAADAKKAEAFYQEGGYTPETIQAFENAYNAAVASNNNRLLKSQQVQVDQIANNLKSARENLKLKTFTVVFVDEDGAIIKDGFFYVTYGEQVTPPANPEKESDHTNHYIFTGWDSDSDPLSACDKVVDDLKFIAKFNAAAHSFSTQTIPSTCTTDGVIKKTCTVCGYSYTETGSDLAHHRWVENKVVKAATCSENGITATECLVCGVYKEGSIRSVEKTAHTFGNWTVYTPATCAGQGVNVRECSVCHAKEYTKTNKIAHSFGATTVVPATCTAGGYSKRTCSMCGLVDIFDLTDATGHTSTTTTKPATCVSIGYTETTCTKCGHKTVEEIPATGTHTFGSWTKITDATCISNGVEKRECTVCQTVETRLTDMKQHSWSAWTTYQQETCTTDRVEQRVCSVCKQLETQTVPNTKGHQWGDVTVDEPATCKSAGVKSKHCSRCDARTDVTVIPALDHTWGEPAVTDATCTADGVKTYTCTSCNTTKTEVIPKLGHNFVAGTPVAATCKSSGYIPYTCANGCGESYKVINGDSSTVHDWNITTSTANGKTTVSGVCTVCGATFSKTVDSAHDFKDITTNKPATCSEKGLLVIACADTGCSEALSVELPVNPNAHSAIKTTVTNPTCTAEGKVTTVCEACNATVAAEQTIPAKGHSLSGAPTNYVAPTCKTEGSVTYTCTVSGCNATKTDTIPVNPNAHNFVPNIHHAATCTTPEYDEYVCLNGCGETYNKYDGSSTVKAHVWKFTTSKTGTTLTVTCKCENCNASHTQTIDVAEGHNYVNATVTKQPTCKETGTVTIACDKAHDANCTSVVTATLPVNPDAHDKLKTTVTPATCEANGKAVTICESCGKTVGESATIAALGHDYVGGEETVITAATCENDGVKTVQCTRCTNTMETVIPKTGHKWDGGTPHAADCTHGAYTTYKCSTCQKTYDAVVDGAKALGHDWSDWVIVNPTNDKAGSATRTCNRCPETETVEIKAQGHTFDAATYTETAATCTAKGSRTYTCTAHENCGVSVTVDTDLAQHSYNDGVRTEATCTERAYTTYTCTGCGRVRVVFDDTDAGKPTGHNYVYGKSTAACEAEGTVEVTCSKCGDVQTNVPVPALGHDFSEEQTVVDATCHSVGYTVYKCSRCDKTKTEYKNELVAHNWSDWKVTKEPTDTENGEQERHCTNEGCTETETAPIPAKIHNWVEQPELATDATCTDAATKTYYCSGCDICTDTENLENNAHWVETVGVPLQHSVKVDYNAPTCTENGSYRAYCDRCNEVEFVSETIAPTGHSFNTRTGYQAPTCSAEGFVEFSCDCGKTKKETLETVPSAHSWELKEIVAATCKAAGYKVYVCKHDNTHTYKEFLSDPVKHTEGEWVTKRAATCSSDGYEVLECKDCGAIMDTRAIPATNEHNFVEVKSDNAEPTCTEGSYSYNKCSDCGKLKENSFVSKDALGHDFSNFVEKKDATATDNGYVLYKCSRCEKTLKSIIPASGHSYTSEVTKEATCTEKGVRTYTCTVEGHDDSYTEEIPALGHKAGDVEITPATCLAEGSAVVKCTRCGDTLQTEPLPTLAHTFNEAHKTVIPATCQTTGSITYTCATEGCTATLVTTLEKTPHDYKLVKNVAPTCLDSGYDVYACSAEGCKASYNVVTKSANGHSFVEDTARTVQPTCSTVGHRYFKCSVCDAEGYDYEVPATGKHTYNETVKVAPTCESAGYTYNKCTVCDAVDKDSVKAIDPLGHDYSVDNGDGTVSCSRTGCASRITVEKVITDEDGTHAFEGKITKQSTCKVQGTIEYTCRTHKNCAKNHTEALPLAEHSATADSIVTIEPVCKEDGTLTDGSIVVKCSVCGTQIGDTVALPAAHKYTVVKVERATCGSKGKVTERCSVCGHEKVTELEMNASAHEFNSLPSIKVDPTCTTDGYEVYDCKHCDAQKFVKTGEKLNHKHTESVTKDATCTSEGYTRITCKDCGNIISETIIEKTAHVEAVVKVDATCTRQGSVTTKCSVCGKLLKETEYTPALGHKWSDWKVISGGTCSVEGQRQRECTVCHETETISTGIGEHVYPEKGVVTPPTCTTDGFTTYTCTVCHNHSIIKDYTPKLGHKYSSDYRIVREPTCHSTGSKAHYCVNCNAIEPEHNEAYVEIPKLAHTYGEWTVTVEPTCENTGIKERTCVNEGCAEKDEGHVETAVVGRLGHHYGDWTVVKEPTCVENGTKQRICDRCNGVETEAVAMTRHTRVADPEVPATCVKTGLTAGSHCSVCGKVFVAQKEIPMISHMDLGGDGKCDTCGKVMTDKTGTDTCFCHGTGFRALVYRFVRLIWKLFKVNQYCTCGAKHW